MESLALDLGAKYKYTVDQTDTYFVVPHGRLKLRESRRHPSELIYYDRVEDGSERWSRYEVVKFESHEKLKGILTDGLGVKCAVSKKRRLYLFKSARIHIDTVSGLGDFLEFEVVVKKSKRKAKELLKTLLLHFRLDRSNSIDSSYSDLTLLSQQGS
jgi:predicted adenylyl cyclase CyaB